MSLTLERLKEVLSYDQETGVFRWRITLSNRVQAGSIAGTKSNDDYVRINVDGKRYLGHRLAWFYMNGKWPSAHIDHRDTDRRQNRWNNFRLADDSQNGANRKENRNNSTGFKGVTFMRRRAHHARPFVAQIKVKRKRIFLGHFATAEDAHAAYCKAAQTYFGEFSRAA
ncbi:HNH endonuclease [Bradyrhizobium japonicum]|uniref:HNH endonuclease n=1 Tax=Bradyrhizobium japonicum TaxID=375 RepID=UPI0006762595|nr:HNH endonuclease [Bradyrhizobium japonicum]